MTEDWWSSLTARRHVSLRRLGLPAPDESELQRIFEAAAQAPDHGMLLPWRFILIPPEKRTALGDVFVGALIHEHPDCDDAARAMAHAKAFHAPCLLVAVLADDPSASSIPTAEKLVSLGCAIQGMLVAAQALHYASGLASGRNMDCPGMRRFLRLAAHEQAICFIGFGTASSSKPPRQRPYPASFVSVL
jgi:nitroreductase